MFIWGLYLGCAAGVGSGPGLVVRWPPSSLRCLPTSDGRHVEVGLWFDTRLPNGRRIVADVVPKIAPRNTEYAHYQ